MPTRIWMYTTRWVNIKFTHPPPIFQHCGQHWTPEGNTEHPTIPLRCSGQFIIPRPLKAQIALLIVFRRLPLVCFGYDSLAAEYDTYDSCWHEEKRSC